MMVMTREEQRQQVRGFFAEQLPLWSDDTSDTDPLDRSGLDSTGFVMLVLFLEETFNIQILDEDLTAKNLGTVESILSFVNRKLEA
jgi:acyl carrier protein